MPQSIPPGLKQEHVLRTLADLNGGIDHPFGQPNGYELSTTASFPKCDAKQHLWLKR